MNNRSLIIDQTKGVLIFLVVLGHFANWQHELYLMGLETVYNPVLRGGYNSILSFHMPAFIFISGYFSRHISNLRYKELDSILYPFILFQILNVFFTMTTGWGYGKNYNILYPIYQNWYIPFLQWSRENDCAPDFLNFNYYELVFNERDSGQEAFGFTQSMALRETAEGFDSFVMQALSERHMLAADKLPLYLSEWNNTPSQQDLLNDTCFKSCYIAKCILENYDKLDSFAYWSLTDWMGEAAQPKDMYFGGLGLFTANGVPKASYMVFTLLRRLGDTLLGKGEGWFITRKGASYQIMLYHYRHFSHLYALGERFDMTFTDRYTPFSPEQMLDVHLVLKDCRDGEYIVTETIVNRASGSSFDQWVAMGAEELTEPGELDTLAARSTPAINKYTVSAEGGALRLDAMLDMLEVRLIDIKRR